MSLGDWEHLANMAVNPVALYNSVADSGSIQTPVGGAKWGPTSGPVPGPPQDAQVNNAIRAANPNASGPTLAALFQIAAYQQAGQPVPDTLYTRLSSTGGGVFPPGIKGVNPGPAVKGGTTPQTQALTQGQTPTGAPMTQGPANPVVTPGSTSVSQQVNAGLQTGANYGGIGSQYEQLLRGNIGQQQSLADLYRRTISDPNAPSVAREQLNQALNANNNTQLSNAAGASGANAAIARTNAANNMAMGGAQAGQAAALLRAQEVAAAQRGLGETLNQIGGASGRAAENYAGLGKDYAALGIQGVNAANANSTNVRGQNIGLLKDLAVGGASAANSYTSGNSGTDALDSNGLTQNGEQLAANDSTDETANELQGSDSAGI